MSPAAKNASQIGSLATIILSITAIVFHQRARVALDAGEFGAFDGAAAEAFDVGFVGQVDNVRERGRDAVGAGLEARLFGGLLEAVPGAHVLARVAAVEPAFEVRGYVSGKL